MFPSRSNVFRFRGDEGLEWMWKTSVESDSSQWLAVEGNSIWFSFNFDGSRRRSNVRSVEANLRSFPSSTELPIKSQTNVRRRANGIFFSSLKIEPKSNGQLPFREWRNTFDFRSLTRSFREMNWFFTVNRTVPELCWTWSKSIKSMPRPCRSWISQWNVR